MCLQHLEVMRMLIVIAIWIALGGSTMAQADLENYGLRVAAFPNDTTLLPPQPTVQYAPMDFFDLPPATQAFYWGFFATNEEAADPHPEATLERLRLEAEVLEYDLGVLCRRIMLMECRPDAKGTLPGYSLPETNKP